MRKDMNMHGFISGIFYMAQIIELSQWAYILHKQENNFLWIFPNEGVDNRVGTLWFVFIYRVMFFIHVLFFFFFF